MGDRHRHRPSAVLFDRDGTLIGARAQPVPGAHAALARLRAADIPLGVVTNQPGVAKGLLSADEMDRVNARVEELLGPFDAWAICVHDESDGCICRWPAPGLVVRAAAFLDLSPRDCLLVGDAGDDMAAARAVGCRGILVPSPRTCRADLDAAGEVAHDLADVADRVLNEPVPAGVAGLVDWAKEVGWSRW